MHGKPNAREIAESQLDRDLRTPIEKQHLLPHIRPLRKDERLIEGLRRIDSDAPEVISARTRASGPSKSTDVFYYYVTDADGKLCGIVPHHAVVALAVRAIMDESFDARTVVVEAVMNSQPIRRIRSPATMLDAYEAFMGNSFLAVPLVDENEHFLSCVGRSAFDTVKSDLFASSESEIARAQHLAEHAESERAETARELEAAHALVRTDGERRSFRAELLDRSFGLSFNLGHSIVTSFMLVHFEDVMMRIMILASLIPSFLAFSECLGGQSNHIALHRQTERSRGIAAMREFTVAAVLALACSFLLGLVVACSHSSNAGLCVFLAMLASMLLTAMLCHAQPRLLKFAGLDPRLLGHSVVLAVADIVTIGLVFGIASLVL
jgi:Mg/Co/Ni transporter MgtE